MMHSLNSRIELADFPDLEDWPEVDCYDKTMD